MRLRYTTLAAAVLAVGACGPDLDPVAMDASAIEQVVSQQKNGTKASGGGHFLIGDLDIRFSFTAIQTGVDGAAKGKANHSVVLGGELVEFQTDVTCLTVDAATGRAWIGGVVLANRSTHPAFTTPINDPGRDIWFRVVDYGEGAGAPQADRSTFVGFEGGAGIITSEEYCATQPWPEDDARTNALSAGNIQVKP